MAFFGPTCEAIQFRTQQTLTKSFFERIKETFSNYKGSLVSVSQCLPSIATWEPSLNAKTFSDSDFFLPPCTSGEDSPLLSENNELEKSNPSLKEITSFLVDSSLLKLESKEPERVPHHLLSSKNFTSKIYFFEDIKEGVTAASIEEHLKHSFLSATNNALSFKGAKAEIIYFRGLWAAIVKFENGRQGDFLYFNLNSRTKHTSIFGENYRVYELVSDQRRKVKEWFAVVLRNLRSDIEKQHIIERISTRLQLKNFSVEELMHFRHHNHALIKVASMEDAEALCKHFQGSKNEASDGIKANIHPHSSKKRQNNAAPIFQIPESSIEAQKPNITVVQPIILVPSKIATETKQISQKEDLYSYSPKKPSKYSSMYSNDESNHRKHKRS